MQQSIELDHRGGLEIRLKTTPATVPLVVQANKQSKVELRNRLAEASQGCDGPAGICGLTPGQGHPVNGDALHCRGIGCNHDVSLGNRVGEQLLKHPQIVWVMASKHAH